MGMAQPWWELSLMETLKDPALISWQGSWMIPTSLSCGWRRSASWATWDWQQASRHFFTWCSVLTWSILRYLALLYEYLLTYFTVPFYPGVGNSLWFPAKSFSRFWKWWRFVIWNPFLSGLDKTHLGTRTNKSKTTAESKLMKYHMQLGKVLGARNVWTVL